MTKSPRHALRYPVYAYRRIFYGIEFPGRGTYLKSPPRNVGICSTIRKASSSSLGRSAFAPFILLPTVAPKPDADLFRPAPTAGLQREPNRAAFPVVRPAAARRDPINLPTRVVIQGVFLSIARRRTRVHRSLTVGVGRRPFKQSRSLNFTGRPSNVGIVSAFLYGKWSSAYGFQNPVPTAISSATLLTSNRLLRQSLGRFRDAEHPPRPIDRLGGFFSTSFTLPFSPPGMPGKPKISLP